MSKNNENISYFLKPLNDVLEKIHIPSLNDNITTVKTFVTPELINNGVLHMLILFTFLSFLYIAFISTLTKNLFDKHIKKAIKNVVKINYNNNIKDLNEKKNMLGEKYANLIDKYLNKNNYVKKFVFGENYNRLIDTYSEESDYVKIQNNWLFGSLIATIFGSWIIYALFMYQLKYGCNNQKSTVHLLHALKINAITFFFVGIIEYAFFTNIALHYVPSKPSILEETFIKNLKKAFD
jgi:hypothetical protein